jgi:tetratricopeptide (TPR) repeat protein
MLSLGDEVKGVPSEWHRTIEGQGELGMKSGLQLSLFLAGCLAAAVPVLQAQASNSDQQPTQQNQAPAKPSSGQPLGGNPFPEDETNVPVMPSHNTPDIPAMGSGAAAAGSAPAVDRDPVASPEDGMPGPQAGETSEFSSSTSGLDNVTIPPPEPEGRKHKGDSSDLDSMPRENPKEDVSVGNYYLDNKDWRGALSRFQSALVLDPENPDIYWGLAECERHLGQFAEARENYLKVMEYDPDSHHAKDAKKALKDPQLANAKAAVPK